MCSTDINLIADKDRKIIDRNRDQLLPRCPFFAHYNGIC